DPQADRRYLDRFELTVQAIQQTLRALSSGTADQESVQRLTDAEQYLGQIIRGLRGEDTSLGVTPVRGQAAQANLESATRLFEQTRAAIGTIAAGAAQLATAQTAVTSIDKEAGSLLSDYRRGGAGPLGAVGLRASSGNVPLVLIGAAALLVLLMVLIYYQSRGFRRAAESQAEQNERNQQAILRL